MDVKKWQEDMRKLLTKRRWDAKELHRAIGIGQHILENLLSGEIENPDEKVLEMTFELAKKSEKSKLLRFERPLIIAFWAYKGGTGKTTCAANIGYELGKRGYNVLEIDSDGQANLSGVLYPEFATLDKSFDDAISFSRSFINYIVPTEYDNLDLVPGNLGGENLGELIGFHKEKRQQEIWNLCVNEVIEENYYDFIIIDMDKTMSSINRLILKNVDYLIAPIEEGIFSVQGVPAIQSIISEIEKENERFELLGFLFNKVDKRRNLLDSTKTLVESLGHEYMFDEFLSMCADVEKSQRAHMPVGYYKKSSVVNKQVMSLTDEILNKIQNSQKNRKRRDEDASR